MYPSFPSSRPRRLRQSVSIRNLVQETSLSVHDLIYPLFVIDETSGKSEITSMPACYRHSLPSLVDEARQAYESGIQAVALFPVIHKGLKNEVATEAYNPNGLIGRTIKALKREIPELCVIADVALDPFTSHGHDGLCDEKGKILNEPTVEVLIKQALIQAEAGADIVAPSDMMDGRIVCIRRALDENGFNDVLILSYSAKFASSFYGPFRDALSSTLSFGDKKTYQLNPANPLEAEKEILLDEAEGADLLMVKPGLPYLDILYRARQLSKLPLVVYSVSGEYSMIKAAAQNNWLDEEKVVMESMYAFKRAGAQMVITYHAKQIADWLKA